MHETSTMLDPYVVCGYCGKPRMNCTCGTTEGTEWISPHLLDKSEMI